MRRRVAAAAKNGTKTAPQPTTVDRRARLQSAREPDKNAMPEMLGAAHPGRLVPHPYSQADAAVAGVDALRAREDRQERPRAQEPARDDVPPVRRDLARARRGAAARRRSATCARRPTTWGRRYPRRSARRPPGAAASLDAAAQTEEDG